MHCTVLTAWLLHGDDAATALRCSVEPRRAGTRPCTSAVMAAARRQCYRRSSPLPSSGARATARWHGAVLDGGRCAARCGAVDRGIPAKYRQHASWPVASLAEATLGRFLAACAASASAASYAAVLSALAARRQCGPSTPTTTPAAPLPRALLLASLACFFQTGGW
eukprot:scaffold70103_cov84-Phaeocystis_antarctica.AAC.5